MTPERQLRVKQILCISFLALIVLLRHLGFLGNSPRRAMNFSQFLVIGAALWSALSYFTIQRRLTVRPQSLGRWMTNHLVRLGSATSVGMWALLLYYLGGPRWVVDALSVIGLILLMIWKPGASPSRNNQETNIDG